MKIRIARHLASTARLLLLVLLGFVPTTYGQTNPVLLPTSLVSVGVAPITDPFLITNSFAWVEITNVAGGYSVTNGYYRAWCVQADTPFSDTNWFSTLFDSLGTNLPVALQSEPWPLVNYILNHKLGSALEVQDAIWWVQDGTDLFDIDPGPTYDMVAAARKHGTNFFPSPGQVRAVVVDANSGVQRLIIEIVDPIRPEPPQVSLGISRTNNLVTLTWRSSSTGFILQEMHGDASDPRWSNAAVVPVDNATDKIFVMPATLGSRLYRLYKP